jgi:hypothetical protein
MAPWGLTEPVLRRVRKLTLQIFQPAIGQPNEHERACVKKVWAHLGVYMARYDEKDNWSFVEKVDRPQVTEKLEAIFGKAAFSKNKDADEAREARDKFKKADLLAWGARLLADASAESDWDEEEFLRLILDLASPETLNDLEKFYDHPALIGTNPGVLPARLRFLGEHPKQQDVLVRLLPILEQTYGRDHAMVHITRKKIISLEQEHGLDHPKVGSALENVTNADLMSEDIGTWTCSGSVENVSKLTWKSRSRDGSSRGGDRRSDLPSDSASLDHFVMDPDLANSGTLLGEALSSNLSMVDSQPRTESTHAARP